jgi:hypothetical protein
MATPGEHFDDADDPITVAETPLALLCRTLERFASGAEAIQRAIPLLEKLDGPEREYFAARLADDVLEFGQGVPELAAAIRIAYPR